MLLKQVPAVFTFRKQMHLSSYGNRARVVTKWVKFNIPTYDIDRTIYFDNGDSSRSNILILTRPRWSFNTTIEQIYFRLYMLKPCKHNTPISIGIKNNLYYTRYNYGTLEPINNNNTTLGIHIDIVEK